MILAPNGAMMAQGKVSGDGGLWQWHGCEGRSGVKYDSTGFGGNDLATAKYVRYAHDGMALWHGWRISERMILMASVLHGAGAYVQPWRMMGNGGGWRHGG
ncbi:hypothetical protein EVAR_22215_1 [Eumeta japonica]|uniref:Uncharacterized protein n=1 Tax=Eumeta variegata TaxID=151549 RepID=A0A4C1UB78_EUMVA|nr:hypothetical protein EVAR_22215_1 [Eumeta japonica]